MKNEFFKKNIKPLLPSKDIFYTFVFNLVLLGLTLGLGYMYIPKLLQDNSFNRIEAQNRIEKRNEFLKDFTYLGQSRIYLAERYYKNKKACEDSSLLQVSWDDYMAGVKSWNNTNLLNPIFITHYFNNTAKDDYYNKLVKKFVDLHEYLLIIRDGEVVDEIKGEELIEIVKNELFSFSERMFFDGYK